MRTPKRCLKYDTTHDFHYQIDNIIMPDSSNKNNSNNFFKSQIILASTSALLIRETISQTNQIKSINHIKEINQNQNKCWLLRVGEN